MILNKVVKDKLKFRFYILFIFYTLLFLFYPGDSYYFDIFAHHKELFMAKEAIPSLKINPIPVLRSQYYPQISAEGVYVVELASFTPIFEKNTHNKFFPASTTKIITALVANDLFQPDDVITVTKLRSNGHTMGLVAGERITAENLLYGMLVYSGNDAAYALADAKDYVAFIALMNKKARDLKMVNTNFQNPAGLDEFNNYTSPFDLALAARALLKDHYLAKFVSTKDITVSDVDFKYFHKLTNINKLLGEIAGLGGLKTGYTEAAGENLVSFYKDPQGHEYIIVIVKSEDRFEDTKVIIDWIQTNIDYINPQ